jgi:hypothetical protein
MGKVLTDLLGYFKRNVRKMDDYQLQKGLNENKQITIIFEKELKQRGLIKHVG